MIFRQFMMFQYRFDLPQLKRDLVSTINFFAQVALQVFKLLQA